MPELPEVEAARRAIADNCIGKKIVKAIIADDPKVIDGVSPMDFKASLEGKTIVAANRKGKNMWIELDSPPFPTFQFGMTGAIYIKGVAVTKYKRSAVKDDEEWPSKYSKVFLELDDGLELSFTDKRRFARVRLLENPVSVPPISELGPDALLEPMTADEFYKALSKKKNGKRSKEIKALLLDQSFISGIGNWIADEVLYQARIHPMQSASSISKEGCATLLKCINEVIEFAVEVDADCSSFPSEWLFHYRWGKKAGKVNGKKIEFITAGGRTSAFVPDLQKNTGAESAKAAGKRQQGKVQRVKHNNSDGQDEEAEAGKSEVKQRGTNTKRASTNKKSKESNSDNDENDSDEGLKKPSGKSKQNRSSKGKDGDQKKKPRGTNMAAKRKLEESDDEINDNSDASGGDNDNEQSKDRKLSSKTQSKGKKTTKQAAEQRQTRNKPSKKQK
ncbi:formamidopyrimidine-DNA glycosylase isoform X2 [Lycium ferocissimum]|uniref:formamidopyrimidine-DNA glycosylase isoform X2 n=1 Tax=Lycium ferocissimum TaxID=112874 RepID=UPI0028158357|nr:formamidopyrimidine-DNA glycosylase isoform X2 [Lycium ferocissimum]